jgi:hypothetical protein
MVQSRVMSDKISRVRSWHVDAVHVARFHVIPEPRDDSIEDS